MNFTLKRFVFLVLPLVVVLETAFVLFGSLEVRIVGSAFLLLVVGVILSGFRRVPEEQRWVIEIFGRYHRTTRPGLCWLVPLLERVRTKASVWVQKWTLFTAPIKIDFKDGSATPKDAFVYVQCNLSEFAPSKDEKDKDDPCPDPDPDEEAVYKMVYATEGLKPAVVGLIENAVRSYLNSLTIDEALPGGRGGYNIVQKIKDAAVDSKVDSVQVVDLNGIKKQLAAWGLRLVRVTIGDFDLSETLIRARESVSQAEQAEKAAKHEATRRSSETVGVKVRMLADALGITVENVQKMLNDPANKDLRDRVFEDSQTILEDRIAGAMGTLIRSRGNPGETAGLNLLSMLGTILGHGTKSQRSETSRSAATTPEKGKRRKKKAEETADEENDEENDEETEEQIEKDIEEAGKAKEEEEKKE